MSVSLYCSYFSLWEINVKYAVQVLSQINVLSHFWNKCPRIHKGPTGAYTFSMIMTHSLDQHALLRCCGHWQLTSLAGRRPTEVAGWNHFNILTPPRTESVRGSKGLDHGRDVTVWRNASRQKVEFFCSAACLPCFFFLQRERTFHWRIFVFI
jgi:hypothetical protein